MGTCGWSRKPPGERTWVHDLPRIVHTGDVVLFSSVHSTSNITKVFTNSSWDHVGIVVRPRTDAIYILEWAGGLFIEPLVPRLTEYYELDGRQIGLRPLKFKRGEREAHERKLETFAAKMLREKRGANTAIPVSEVVSAARKQLISFGSGSAAVEDDLDALFCSKTVAACYKAIGIIAANRSAADVLPKHFDEAHEGFLELQGGAWLGPMLPLSFEPPALRQPVLRLLGLAGPTERRGQQRQKEDRAALRIQVAARRWLARGLSRDLRVERFISSIERCLTCFFIAGSHGELRYYDGREDAVPVAAGRSKTSSDHAVDKARPKKQSVATRRDLKMPIPNSKTRHLSAAARGDVSGGGFADLVVPAAPRAADLEQAWRGLQYQQHGGMAQEQLPAEPARQPRMTPPRADNVDSYRAHAGPRADAGTRVLSPRSATPPVGVARPRAPVERPPSQRRATSATSASTRFSYNVAHFPERSIEE